MTVCKVGDSQNAVKSPEKAGEPLVEKPSVVEPRRMIDSSTPASGPVGKRGPSKPLLQAKNLPSHIQRLNNNIEVDVLTNKVPQLSIDGTSMKFNIPTDYVVIDKIDDIFYRAVNIYFLTLIKSLHKIIFPSCLFFRLQLYRMNAILDSAWKEFA